MEKEISDFMADKFPTAESFQAVDQGHYSSAFSFENAGKPLILRLSPKDSHFYRDRFIYEQYGQQLPVAEVLDIGRFDEKRFYCISSELPGQKLAELRSVGETTKRAFIQQLTRISSVEVGGSSGYGKVLQTGGEFSSWKDFLLAWQSPQSESYKKLQIQMDTGHLQPTVLRDAQAATDELTTKTYEQRHLIHGDYQPYNILVEGGVVRAVLDWGNVKYGDFAYDIIWTSMHPPQVASEQELTDEYASTGFNMANIEKRLLAVKISIYVSWAMFSNEIGNYEESQKNQRDLAKLLG